MVISSSFTPGIAAEGVLQTIQRFMGSYGVSLTYRDSKVQQYHPIISVGYTPSLVHYLANDFPRQVRAFREVESNPDQLFCWHDFPGFRESTCVQQWFKPQGISEGSSMILRDAAGQISGALHVSLRARSFPEDGLRLLKAIRPELEHTVSKIRNFRNLRLTPREIEVLTLMKKGRTNTSIANHLRLSPSTVRAHVENILRKMAVDSRTEAAVKAEQWGIAMSSAPVQLAG